MTAVVVIGGESGSAYIKVLDGEQSFDQTLSSMDIESFCKPDQSKPSSVFDSSKLVSPEKYRQIQV